MTAPESDGSETELTVKSIKAAMLHGKINVVTVAISTNYSGADGQHKVEFRHVSKGGGSEIKQTNHKHPYGNTLRSPDSLARDAIRAQEVARRELAKRNLDDTSEWKSVD